MNVNDVFPSNYIKASDLRGSQVTVTMQRIQIEEVGDGPKPVLYFQGKDKGLVLNKTNANTIAGMYGPEMDGWAGRPVTLFATQVDFQGRQVEAIRVQIQRPTPVNPAATMPSIGPDPFGSDTTDYNGLDNSDVPF